MPLFFASLAKFISAVTFGLFLRWGLSLGLGIVSFTGILSLIDVASNAIDNAYAGLPATVVQLFAIANIPFAISFLMACVTFKASYGFSTRWVKPVGGAE